MGSLKVNSILYNLRIVLYTEPFHHQQWEFLQFEVGGQEQSDSRDQDLVSNDTTTMLSMLNYLLLEVHNQPILNKILYCKIIGYFDTCIHATYSVNCVTCFGRLRSSEKKFKIQILAKIFSKNIFELFTFLGIKKSSNL